MPNLQKQLKSKVRHSKYVNIQITEILIEKKSHLDRSISWARYHYILVEVHIMDIASMTVIHLPKKSSVLGIEAEDTLVPNVKIKKNSVT